MSIAYAHESLGLGPPHPERIALAQEPLGFRCVWFSQTIRYSCRHSHFRPLQPSFRSTFAAERNAPLPRALSCSRSRKRTHSFGGALSPVSLSAPRHSTSELLRTLSRMAASKPTSWLSRQHDRLSHYSAHLGTLADGLGCFPLDDESWHPPSHFHSPLRAFMVWLGSVSAWPPHPSSVPTSRNGARAELNLNPFRGEPAISGFDWYFTSTHSSSVQFCNIEQFGPPVRVTGPSAWPWVAHPVSGLLAAMRVLFQELPCGSSLASPQTPCSDSLSLRLGSSTDRQHTTTRNSPAHSSIGTP